MITKPRGRAIRRPREKGEPKKYRRRRCQLVTCHQLFTPIRSNQRFCCREHKQEFHFKTETYSRVKAEVLKLVEEKCFALVERLARRVYLELETAPPPALVARVADRIADMTGLAKRDRPVAVLSGPFPSS
jgi:hypothetical protein